MKIGRHSLLGVLILVMALRKTRQVPARSDQACSPYQYKSNTLQKCCSRCLPGHYAVKECTESLDTQCQPCRAGTYSSSWSYFSNCRTCQPCVDDLVLKENCSSTKDYVCVCKNGFNCTQYNALGTRCRICEPVVQPTAILLQTTSASPKMAQGYPPWVIVILVSTIVLFLSVVLGLLHASRKTIVDKYVCKIKKPQTECTDLGAKRLPHTGCKVAIAEVGENLAFPIEETDATQSAVLLPNSFSPHSNGSTQ